MDERRPRWPKYALVGGAVGFVVAAVVARSMTCPGSDCIDTKEASFPIMGVVFYGALGAGAGALIGGGIGALVDAKTAPR